MVACFVTYGKLAMTKSWGRVFQSCRRSKKGWERVFVVFISKRQSQIARELVAPFSPSLLDNYHVDLEITVLRGHGQRHKPPRSMAVAKAKKCQSSFG